MVQPIRRRTLVLGGLRSGKSEFAETLVAPEPVVRYVATAPTGRAGHPASDAERAWADRIAAHRARRPSSWATVEIGDHPLILPDLIAAADSTETLLIEELGTWTAAVTDFTTGDPLMTELDRLIGAVRASPANLVIVSPETGLGAEPTTIAGRRFVDAVGWLNRQIAVECDIVVLVIAGQPVAVKGRL